MAATAAAVAAVAAVAMVVVVVVAVVAAAAVAAMAAAAVAVAADVPRHPTFGSVSESKRFQEPQPSGSLTYVRSGRSTPIVSI